MPDASPLGRDSSTSCSMSSVGATARSAGPVPKAFRAIRAIERICAVEFPGWVVMSAADSGNAAIFRVNCCTFPRPSAGALGLFFVH
jgi:hypothetical protein